jgi:hypothetical protein
MVSQHSDFEQQIAELVVNDFSGFETATIYRNRRYAGVRQPGAYEVDVAIELVIGGALTYLTIVECKYLSRKVDRPLVQKLIQTRDAIAAHKCVFVTNRGFTEEAREVAIAHGVGLWVVGKTTRITVWGSDPLEDVFESGVNLRKAFSELVGYRAPIPSELMLMNDEYGFTNPMFELFVLIRGPLATWPVHFHNDENWVDAFVYDGTRVGEDYSTPTTNFRFAFAEFFTDLFDALLQTNLPMREEGLKLLDTYIEATNEFRKQPFLRTANLPNEHLVAIFEASALPVNGSRMKRANLWATARKIGFDPFFNRLMSFELEHGRVILSSYEDR